MISSQLFSVGERRYNHHLHCAAPTAIAINKSTHLILFEDPVNPEHVIEDFVKEHKRYVQLFLVEHLQPGLDVVSQLLLVYWEVVLGQPVTVQDGAIESRLNGCVCVGGESGVYECQLTSAL